MPVNNEPYDDHPHCCADSSTTDAEHEYVGLQTANGCVSTKISTSFFTKCFLSIHFGMLCEVSNP